MWDVDGVEKLSRCTRKCGDLHTGWISRRKRERERERGGYLSYEPDALTIACWFDFEVNEL